MNNTTNITRIPRPLGSTEQSLLYNKTYDDTYYQQLYEKVIHHYIRNNFSYCGIYYNIEQFSKLICVNEMDIQRHLGSYGKELGKLNKELTNGDMVRALTNLSFSWGLEDRSAIQQQVAILQSSQGASYKPFISGELTKAIKVSMDSASNLQSLLKVLMPSGNQSFTPYEEGTEATDKGVTVDEAVRILKANNVPQLLQDPDARDHLKSLYDINNMPEVNALRQVNLDTSKEGLNILDVTKIKDGQIIGHDNRREEEFEIDPDSDDI